MPVNIDGLGQLVGEMHDDEIAHFRPQFRPWGQTVERVDSGDQPITCQIHRQLPADQFNFKNIGIRIEVRGRSQITWTNGARVGSRAR